MKQMRNMLSFVLAMGLLVSCALPLGALAAKSFTDTKGHWSAAYITKGVNHGYINGYENGQFRPNNSVSRAEFCKMINNALDLKNVVTLHFSDIKSSDWFYSEVAKSVGAGYISGYEDGTFRANNQITRQEAAVVISRIVADPSTKKDLSALKDASSIESWAKDGAKSVYSKGYMAGDTKKNFNPKGNLTRGEAVKILESILDGETFTKNDLSLSTSNQTVSDTVYTGKLTVQGTGSATFDNCRMLGKLQVPNDATIRLQDTKVGTLALTGNGGTAQVVASGTTEVLSTVLSGGATLTESAATSSGFRNLDFSGTSLKSQPVYLTGSFESIDVNNSSNIYLRSGSILQLNVNKNASGSRVDLFSGSNLKKAELFVPTIFTGKGTIDLAVQHVTGSTFETAPRNLQGSTSTALVPTIKPGNGAADVSTDTTIDLSFTDITYTSNTALVTTNYVQNSVFELRRDSESGTALSFNVTLSNNNRNYSLKPSSILSQNTRYYVIFKAGSLKNSQGESNARQVFSFYTSKQSSQTVTPYPADGATGIPVTTPVKLTFGEAVYQRNGSTALTSSYLENTAFELHQNSTSGRSLDFDADISSDRRTITLNPDDNLSTSTRYYIVLKGNTIANGNGSTFSGQNYSFTTASSDVLVPAMTPSPGSNKVSASTDLVLDFDTALYTSSGNSTVSDGYLEDDVFTLRRDSANGTLVPFSASINSDRSTVTISPSKSLNNGTTYYLTMLADTLCNASGSSRRYNDKLVLSFTVGNDSDSIQSGDLAPTMSPRNGSSGASTGTNITLTFDDAIYQSNSSRSNITPSYLKDEVLQLHSGSASDSTVSFNASISSNKRVITLSPTRNLSNNTRYYVTVNANSIQTDSKLKNDKFVGSFSCGTTLTYLAPTVNVKDSGTGTSRKPEIQVNFSERLYDKNGTSLDNSSPSRTYLSRYAFELHENRENGSEVGFTVDSVTSNRNLVLKPTGTLTAGKTYCLVLLENQLQDSNGRKNERQAFDFTVGSNMKLTPTPSDGESNVDRSSKIRLSFGDVLYDTSGNRLSSLSTSALYRYLSSSLTLSTSGNSSLDYSLSVSSNGKDLYLSPDDTLLPNRSYTVYLSSGRLSDDNGNTNSAASFSFSTANNQLSPTVSPLNGATNQSLRPSITLSFPENLYYPNSNRILANSDVTSSILELREGGTGGSVIPYNATVGSNRVITITPTSDLANNTIYYVILKANTLANSTYTSGSNASYTSYFTTVAQSSLAASGASIANWDKNAKTQTMTLTFNSTLAAMTQADLLRNLTITSNSGTEVTIRDASVSGSSILLTTDSFVPGARYTVSATANAFSDTAGRKSQAFSFSPTAPAASVILDVSDITKDSVKTQVTYTYPITIMGLTCNGRTFFEGFSPVQNPLQKTFDTLENGTNYTVTLQYQLPGNPSTLTINKNFTTLIPSDDVAFDFFDVITADGSFHPFSKGQKEGQVKLEENSGNRLTLSYKVNNLSKISITSSDPSALSQNILTMGSDPITLTIIVTAENNASVLYTVTIIPYTP